MVRLRGAASSTFGGLPAAFWWIWLGTLVNRLGGFVLPFLAFYITGPLHRSAALAGLVAALFGVGAAVSGVVGGVLTDRVGRKPTLVWSLLANAATIVALGYARSPWALAGGALVVGLATNAFRPAQSAMIADLVPAVDRVRAYALTFWAINLGFPSPGLRHQSVSVPPPGGMWAGHQGERLDQHRSPLWRPVRDVR